MLGTIHAYVHRGGQAQVSLLGPRGHVARHVLALSSESRIQRRCMHRTRSMGVFASSEHFVGEVEMNAYGWPHIRSGIFNISYQSGSPSGTTHGCGDEDAIGGVNLRIYDRGGRGIAARIPSTQTAPRQGVAAEAMRWDGSERAK